MSRYTSWSAADEGILTFPSGLRIRGRGLRALPDLRPDPDFGVYLLGAPLSGQPPWPHIWVRWRDFGTPHDRIAFDHGVREAHRRAGAERVEVACRGGRGRTGCFLACVAALEGMTGAESVDFVRYAYDSRSIETPGQLRLVLHFAEDAARRSAP